MLSVSLSMVFLSCASALLSLQSVLGVFCVLRLVFLFLCPRAFLSCRCHPPPSFYPYSESLESFTLSAHSFPLLRLRLSVLAVNPLESFTVLSVSLPMVFLSCASVLLSLQSVLWGPWSPSTCVPVCPESSCPVRSPSPFCPYSEVWESFAACCLSVCLSARGLPLLRLRLSVRAVSPMESVVVCLSARGLPLLRLRLSVRAVSPMESVVVCLSARGLPLLRLRPSVLVVNPLSPSPYMFVFPWSSCLFILIIQFESFGLLSVYTWPSSPSPPSFCPYSESLRHSPCLSAHGLLVLLSVQ